MGFKLGLLFVVSEGEADGGDGFFLWFEFDESLFVFFLDFGVANNVEKDLEYEVVLRGIGVILWHCGYVNVLYVLDIEGFYDGIELE